MKKFILAIAAIALIACTAPEKTGTVDTTRVDSSKVDSLKRDTTITKDTVKLVVDTVKKAK